MAVIDSIKVDLEINEESLAALERLAALGAHAVRVINPEPGDRLVFLMERRLSREQSEVFKQQAEEVLKCECVVVSDVSEIIHLQADPVTVEPRPLPYEVDNALVRDPG